MGAEGCGHDGGAATVGAANGHAQRRCRHGHAVGCLGPVGGAARCRRGGAIRAAVQDIVSGVDTAVEGDGGDLAGGNEVGAVDGKAAESLSIDQAGHAHASTRGEGAGAAVGHAGDRGELGGGVVGRGGVDAERLRRDADGVVERGDRAAALGDVVGGRAPVVQGVVAGQESVAAADARHVLACRDGVHAGVGDGHAGEPLAASQSADGQGAAGIDGAGAGIGGADAAGELGRPVVEGVEGHAEGRPVDHGGNGAAGEGVIGRVAAGQGQAGGGPLGVGAHVLAGHVGAAGEMDIVAIDDAGAEIELVGSEGRGAVIVLAAVHAQNRQAERVDRCGVLGAAAAQGGQRVVARQSRRAGGSVGQGHAAQRGQIVDGVVSHRRRRGCGGATAGERQRFAIDAGCRDLGVAEAGVTVVGLDGTQGCRGRGDGVGGRDSEVVAQHVVVAVGRVVSRQGAGAQVGVGANVCTGRDVGGRGDIAARIARAVGVHHRHVAEAQVGGGEGAVIHLGAAERGRHVDRQGRHVDGVVGGVQVGIVRAGIDRQQAAVGIAGTAAGGRRTVGEAHALQVAVQDEDQIGDGVGVEVDVAGQPVGGHVEGVGPRGVVGAAPFDSDAAGGGGGGQGRLPGVAAGVVDLHPEDLVGVGPDTPGVFARDVDEAAGRCIGGTRSVVAAVDDGAGANVDGGGIAAAAASLGGITVDRDVAAAGENVRRRADRHRLLAAGIVEGVADAMGGGLGAAHAAASAADEDVPAVGVEGLTAGDAHAAQGAGGGVGRAQRDVQGAAGGRDRTVDGDVAFGQKGQGRGPRGRRLGDGVVDEDVAAATRRAVARGGDGDIVAVDQAGEGRAGGVAPARCHGVVIGVHQQGAGGAVGGQRGHRQGVCHVDGGGAGLDESAVPALRGAGVQGAACVQRAVGQIADQPDLTPLAGRQAAGADQTGVVDGGGGQLIGGPGGEIDEAAIGHDGAAVAHQRIQRPLFHLKLERTAQIQRDTLARRQEHVAGGRIHAAFVAHPCSDQGHRPALASVTCCGDAALVDHCVAASTVEHIAARQEITCAQVPCRRHQAAHIHLGSGRKEHAIRVDEEDLPVGLQGSLDQRDIGAQHTIQGDRTGAGLYEVDRVVPSDRKALPVNGQLVRRLVDGQAVAVLADAAGAGGNAAACRQRARCRGQPGPERREDRNRPHAGMPGLARTACALGHHLPDVQRTIPYNTIDMIHGGPRKGWVAARATCRTSPAAGTGRGGGRRPWDA